MEGLLGQGAGQGRCRFPEVPLASLWPDPAPGCALSSRRRSAIPSSCWSGWRPWVLPAIPVVPVVPRGAAERRAMPLRRRMPVGLGDVAPAACGFHWRVNKRLSPRAACWWPGPRGPWGAVRRCRGWVCAAAVRTGSRPRGSPRCGGGGGCLARTRRWGWSLRDGGSGVPARGAAGLVWVCQRLRAGVEPTEQAETLAEGTLAERGPDPAVCCPVPELQPEVLGARSPGANASEKQKTQQYAAQMLFSFFRSPRANPPHAGNREHPAGKFRASWQRQTSISPGARARGTDRSPPGARPGLLCRAELIPAQRDVPVICVQGGGCPLCPSPCPVSVAAHSRSREFLFLSLCSCFQSLPIALCPAPCPPSALLLIPGFLPAPLRFVFSAGLCLAGKP